MLRVAVIDDERLARQAIRQLLAAHPSLQLVGEADSKDSALALIRQEKPDGVFVDIRLPGGTGFELIQSLDAPPKVVMVTAHAEHTLQAFDIEAIDYLLKPVRPSRLCSACRPPAPQERPPSVSPDSRPKTISASARLSEQ